MPSAPRPSPWKIASQVLFVILLALVFTTFGDYGMSWDQYYRLKEGAKKLDYYQTTLRGEVFDFKVKEDPYPGFYDLSVQLVNLAQPLGPGIIGLIYTDHLLSALCGFFTILAAYRIGVMLGGQRTGFFAALFLAICPHFYGHMFINPKDIPFACMYLWALYYTLKLLRTPKITPWLIAKLSVAYGLTLGVRLGGVFLFAYLALVFLLRLWLHRKEGQAWSRLGRYFGLGCLILASAFAVMLPWWPFAHSDPIGTVIHSLTRVANYPWNGPVVLNGVVYPATQLPWYYLPNLLAVTTPEFLLILGAFALFFTGFSLATKAPAQGSKYFTISRLSAAFLGIAILFPIVVVLLQRSTLYDGIRHFLFVVGPFAIICALTLHKMISIFENAAKDPKTSRVVGIAPIGLAAIILINIASILVEKVRLHPYQYIYYNGFAGGIENAWTRFDTEYWGTSHREALQLLEAHLARQGDTRIYQVTSPMAPWLVENYLPANMVYTNDGRQADFFISFLRFNAHMWSDGELMEDCIVSRKGVPLAIVRDRRAIKATEAKATLQNSPAASAVSTILNMIPDWKESTPKTAAPAQ